MQKRKERNPMPPLEEIYSLYQDKQLSIPRIAGQLNVSASILYHRLSSAGYKMRSNKEAILLEYRTGRFAPPRGPESHAWKGGQYKMGGYIYIYAPDHPRVKRSKDPNRRYIAEHILIWEQLHQRSLPPNWVIHHVNGIKTDNRPENLVGYPKKKHDQLIPELGKRIRSLELENGLLRKALAEHQALFVINEN
jgi:transposase-like protein